MRKILTHPLVSSLKGTDLTKQELSWELVDLVESEIEKADSAYLKGIEDYQSVKALCDICADLFSECNSLSKKHPEHPVIKHNMEILLLVTMNLSMSLMSRPRKAG